MKTSFASAKVFGAILLTAASLLIVGAHVKAAAQNADVKAGVRDANSPFPNTPEGSWLYSVSIPGYDFQGLETYDGSGGYTEADQLSFSPESVASAGHGVWQMTGANTYTLTYANLTFDGFSTGNPNGYLRVRQTTTLSANGNSYSGYGDYTYYNLKGQAEPSISGTFTIKAARITISAPPVQNALGNFR